MLFSELNLPESGSTVLVGMSGGVDSTLTSLLLKERGCTVIGVTMSNWNNALPLESSGTGVRNSCYGPDEKIDIEACIQFCTEQNIKHYVINVQKEYQKNVLDYFRSEYRAGRTPNPCIQCNPFVKFGALLQNTRDLGIHFDYFCTGHYARIVRPNESEIICPERFKGNTIPAHIATGLDKTKDQSYFLYRVPSSTLEMVRFPLGNMTKKQVIALAQERGLIAANRSESQDFIPPEYMEIVFSDKPSIKGNIVDTQGNILGQHNGIENYTIGKRRGLGISSHSPLYVKEINAEKNQIVVAEEHELSVKGLIAHNFVWPHLEYETIPEKPFRAKVKIRFATPAIPALIEPGKDACRIIFDTPQRAVAPGQSAALYQDELIIGGGIISCAINNE